MNAGALAAEVAKLDRALAESLAALDEADFARREAVYLDYLKGCAALYQRLHQNTESTGTQPEN